MAVIGEIIAIAKKLLMGNGYPEEIAERVIQSVDDDTLLKVASGDLALDEASRLARGKDMGVNFDQSWYHSGNDLINRVQPRNYPYTDTQAPFWLADRKDVSATYASGADPQEFFLKGNMASMDAGGEKWNTLRGKSLLDSLGNEVIPKERPSGYRTTDDFVDVVRNQTNDEGLLFNNILDLGGNFSNAKRVITETDPEANIPDIFKHLEGQGHGVAAVINPNNVRSKWALFDKPDTNSVFGSRMAPTTGAGALGLMSALQSEDADAAALESGMPMAMQAGGQSAMGGKPDLGRDAGTLIGLLDLLLPLAGEAFKPATMGNAELTDEQRRQRKYYGQ